MSSNYDKVGQLKGARGVKGVEGRRPDWAGAQELNLGLFELLEKVLDSLAAQDLDAARRAMGLLTYSTHRQAHRLGIDLDEALGQVCAERRSLLSGQREAPELCSC